MEKRRDDARQMFWLQEKTVHRPPTLFMKGDIYGDYTFEGGRNNHHFPNCRKKDQTPGFFAGHWLQQNEPFFFSSKCLQKLKNLWSGCPSNENLIFLRLWIIKLTYKELAIKESKKLLDNGAFQIFKRFLQVAVMKSAVSTKPDLIYFVLWSLDVRWNNEQLARTQLPVS